MEKKGRWIYPRYFTEGNRFFWTDTEKKYDFIVKVIKIYREGRVRYLEMERYLRGAYEIYYYDTIKTKIMRNMFDGNEYVNMPSILKNCDHIVDTLYAPKHRPYFLTEEEEEYL